MSYKVGDLTKNSKWKLTKEVPFYEVKNRNWGSLSCRNTSYNAPVGSEFTVPTKRQSDYIGDRTWNRDKQEYELTWEKNGIYFDMVVNGVNGVVFFEDLKDSIEVLEQPKDIAYLIKDTASGLYFVGEVNYYDKYDEVKRKAAEEKYYQNCRNCTNHQTHQYYIQYRQDVQDALIGKEPDMKKSESALTYENHEYKFAKTPLSGKVLKTLAQAKQKLMVICGYYNNSDASMLHFHPALSTIPESWVLVAYDRTSKSEEVLDINCTEFINHAFELQKLTTNYGSAVRDLYSKLEKKNELEKYKHFLIFTPGDLKQKALKEYLHPDNPLIEENQDQDYYGDQDLPGRFQIKKDEVKTVKELVHKDMKKSFKYDSICVAIEDKIEATELTFTYYGNLSSTLIDMSTLTEIVVPKE